MNMGLSRPVLLQFQVQTGMRWSSVRRFFYALWTYVINGTSLLGKFISLSRVRDTYIPGTMSTWK